MVAMPRLPKSYGPIHYDIHPGNYLMTSDGRMVLFDFENSCRGHYINDIAVVLYYSRMHKFSKGDEGFNHSFLASFWKGYEHEYSVPESEIPHIPWLLLNRSLILYGYLFKIWPGERDDLQEAYIKDVELNILSTRKELGR
jgi:Ser/Thr protein kinase RdoA (MazF antagonist)